MHWNSIRQHLLWPSTVNAEMAKVWRGEKRKAETSSWYMGVNKHPTLAFISIKTQVFYCNRRQETRSQLRCMWKFHNVEHSLILVYCKVIFSSAAILHSFVWNTLVIVSKHFSIAPIPVETQAYSLGLLIYEQLVSKGIINRANGLHRQYSLFANVLTLHRRTKHHVKLTLRAEF